MLHLGFRIYRSFRFVRHLFGKSIVLPKRCRTSVEQESNKVPKKAGKHNIYNRPNIYNQRPTFGDVFSQFKG